ncbi:MAG: M20 family metallo-hydrolase [Bacteroidetes bacterium]|nr:M20 family metallo-hydrolase [Bacteroidota bacterium]
MTSRERLEDALDLLSRLIATPSFSGEESATAAILQAQLSSAGITAHRYLHNVWAANLHFDAGKPTLLLNSHHDTVRPNAGYTRDPFSPTLENGRLYGLGSNDAGGCLVALMAAFRHFYAQERLRYNLIWAGTAEEETSGQNGIAALLPQLPPIDCALVGEPTRLQLAVAEKGLMVLDCTAYGQAGHAAREEGINALYLAVDAIEWFRHYRFPRESALLGPVNMSVTQVSAGTQHNVVPDRCTFVVDIRSTDAYTHEELLAIICRYTSCEVIPRSTRLNPSGIPADHPLVQAGLALGSQPYGSPTLSDQALMPFPSLKAGPGDSARSHTADEYLYVAELEQGIDFYINLLNNLLS